MLAGFGDGLAAAINTQDDERQIRDLVAAWMAASKAGDVETVLGLMAEDVVFLVAGQPPMIGRSAYAAAARAQATPQSPKVDGTSEIQEIRVLGDWAFMWTKLTVVVTPPADAAPLTRAGHTFSILKKHDSRWLLARDANMLVAVPASN